MQKNWNGAENAWDRALNEWLFLMSKIETAQKMREIVR